jgi:hypothetical protein
MERSGYPKRLVWLIMTQLVAAMTRSGRCAFWIGKEGSSLRLKNSGERATWTLARTSLLPILLLIHDANSRLLSIGTRVGDIRIQSISLFASQQYTDGLVETYAMVVRLSAPLHAHPASHNRCSKLYQRKMQKGTAAGSEPGPEISTFHGASKNVRNWDESWLNVENSDQHVYERVRR